MTWHRNRCVFLIPFKLRVGGLWFIVPVIGIKSLISQLAVKDYWVKRGCVPQTKFKKCQSRSHIGYLENEFFLLISPNVASCCLWLAQPGREDGWICHRLVNCVAGLSLTSGLWLLSGSIQNKLADCSHISHSICFDFVECSP